jgi:hypothetical protein
MTWHPNWKAYLDGRATPTTTLSPGFIGVRVGPGHHRIACRYEPSPWKVPAALAGLFLAVFLIVAEARQLPSLRPQWALPKWAPQFATATGLVALALPACISVLTGRKPAGHDAIAQLPVVMVRPLPAAELAPAVAEHDVPAAPLAKEIVAPLEFAGFA